MDHGGSMLSSTGRHELPCSPTRLHQCAYCTYTTKNKTHLVTHIRLHTGERPFACTHCQFSTVTKERLKRHVRIHTGEKPYSCPQCSHRSAEISNLKIHMITHKIKKWFFPSSSKLYMEIKILFIVCGCWTLHIFSHMKLCGSIYPLFFVNRTLHMVQPFFSCETHEVVSWMIILFHLFAL